MGPDPFVRRRLSRWSPTSRYPTTREARLPTSSQYRSDRDPGQSGSIESCRVPVRVHPGGSNDLHRGHERDEKKGQGVARLREIGDGHAAPATSATARASVPVVSRVVAVGLFLRGRGAVGARKPALLSSAAVQPPAFAAS